MVGVGEAHETAETREQIVSAQHHLRRQAQHLHRPSPLGRNATPRIGRVRNRTGARCERLEPGHPLTQSPDLETVGEPRSANELLQRARRGRSLGRTQRGGGQNGADHLGCSPPVAVELEHEAGWSTIIGRVGHDAMTGSVQPVRVGLQAVPEGDPRHREPVGRVADEHREQLALLVVEMVEVLAEHGAEQHHAVALTAGREIRVAERDPSRRLVAPGVMDVQLGEQHDQLADEVVRAGRPSRPRTPRSTPAWRRPSVARSRR